MASAARIAWDAVERFLEDDGWAVSSHIALNGLMSLFPFLIAVTALAGASILFEILALMAFSPSVGGRAVSG